MRATRAGSIAAGGLALVALVGCSTAPSDDQVREASRACSDGFAARPDVVDQAWADEFESVWESGDLWWEFGGGDICQSLRRDVSAETWVAHTDDPAWYVEQYLAR